MRNRYKPRLIHLQNLRRGREEEATGPDDDCDGEEDEDRGCCDTLLFVAPKDTGRNQRLSVCFRIREKHRRPIVTSLRGFTAALQCLTHGLPF